MLKLVKPGSRPQISLFFFFYVQCNTFFFEREISGQREKKREEDVCHIDWQRDDDVVWQMDIACYSLQSPQNPRLKRACVDMLIHVTQSKLAR